jgi:hypothetical protein
MQGSLASDSEEFGPRGAHFAPPILVFTVLGVCPELQRDGCRSIFVGGIDRKHHTHRGVVDPDAHLQRGRAFHLVATAHHATQRTSREVLGVLDSGSDERGVGLGGRGPLL